MPDSADDLLDAYSPAVQDTSQALRTLIRGTVPDAREKTYPGWNSIGYSFDETMKTSFSRSSHTVLMSTFSSPMGSR